MANTIKKKTLNPSVASRKTNLSYGFSLSRVVSFIAIFIITFLVFSKSITGIFIALDDQVYINDNPFIKLISWQNIKNIFTTFYNANYHPFTTLLYAIEYKLFGMDAASYHIVSLFIHGINACFVFIIMEKLELKKISAFVCSLIFAIHPMHVESVVWISEQKDVLYSLFFLGGLVTYLNYLRNRKNKYLLITLILFLFSLFSKSAAVTFPLIMLLCDFYFKRDFNRKTVIEKIPFFLLSLAFGIISILSQNAAGAINDDTMVPYSFFQKIFVVGYALFYYIYKLIIPVDLCVLHYAPKIIPFYFYMCPIILLLIIGFVWRSKHLKRSLIFGFLFYLFSVILVVQIIPLGYVIVSDRYSYISYVGLIFIIGSIHKLVKEDKIPFLKYFKNYIDYIIAAAILIFSYLCFQYIGKWQSSVLLFNDIAEKNPQSAYAYYSLGKVQNVGGDFLTALKSFNYSIELDSTIPETYFCRANIYFEQKKYNLAISDYLNAEKLKPSYPENLNNIAFLYSEIGQMENAIQYYSKAIAVAPTEYLYQRRATCYTYLKNYSEALKDYNKTLEINPFLAEPYYNRGVCYYHIQQVEKACEDWKKSSSMGYKNADNLLIKYCK